MLIESLTESMLCISHSQPTATQQEAEIQCWMRCSCCRFSCTKCPVLTSASQCEHVTAPTMPHNSVPPCRPPAPQHGSHQEQSYVQFDLRYISHLQHRGHQPGQQLINHQQRSQQQLSHQQPHQQLLSQPQPHQQLMSHQPPISHVQPSQQLIGPSRPSQASNSHQQFHLQQQLGIPAVYSLPLPTIPVRSIHILRTVLPQYGPQLGFMPPHDSPAYSVYQTRCGVCACTPREHNCSSYRTPAAVICPATEC